MKFSIHHVGGRGGSRGFPIVHPVEPDVFSVLYDADSESIGEVRLSNSHLPSELRVLPYCLGASAGPGTLYVTRDPYTSSTLRPGKTGLWLEGSPVSKFDYSLDVSTQIVREVQVDFLTLDTVCERHTDIPPPHFLSVDTQGTDLHVLQGARDVLRGIVGVLVEVEFVEMYDGQPLFPDVDAFLKSQCFELQQLDVATGTTRRGPIGMRSRRPLAWAEALYLRPPGGHLDAPLAYAALAFGYAEIAASCARIDEPTNLWEEAVARFQSLAETAPRSLPPPFYREEAAETQRPNAVSRRVALRRSVIDVLDSLGARRHVQRAMAAPGRWLRRGRLARAQRPYLRFARRYGFRHLEDGYHARRNLL